MINGNENQTAYAYIKLNGNGTEDVCFDTETGSYVIRKSNLLREGNLNTLRFLAPQIYGKNIVYEMPPAGLPITACIKDSPCWNLSKDDVKKIRPKILLTKRIMPNERSE